MQQEQVIVVLTSSAVQLGSVQFVHQELQEILLNLQLKLLHLVQHVLIHVQIMNILVERIVLLCVEQLVQLRPILYVKVIFIVTIMHVLNVQVLH